MNNTTSEAPHVVQGLPVFEYMSWNVFWIFFVLILFNFILLPRQMESPEGPKHPVYNTRTTRRHTTAGHSGRNQSRPAKNGLYNTNSPPATETGPCESRTIFKWIPASLVFRNITSRNIQCNVAIISSLLLLAQIIEGSWIMEMLARYISQGVDPVPNEAAPAKSFVLISLILHGIRCLGKLFIWLLFLAIGGFVVTMQYDFIRAVLNIRIEQHQAGCQCEAKTKDGVNRNGEIDLELGKLEVILESPDER